MKLWKNLFIVAMILPLIFFAASCTKKSSVQKPIKTFVSPEIKTGDDGKDGSYHVTIDFFKNGTWVCNVASGNESFPLLQGFYTGDVTRDTNNDNHVTMTIPKNAKTSDGAKTPDGTDKNIETDKTQLSWDKDYVETVIIKNGDIDWDYFWLFYKDEKKNGFFDNISNFFGKIFG